MDNSKYDFKNIEKKWQEKWEKRGIYRTEDFSEKEKFYCLSMFPYPSGDGIHMGHSENYTGIDIVSRFKKMQEKNVLNPIGWDAFGLPAENYAIKTGVHPDEITHQNIKNFTRQLKSLGISYDWSKEIDTSLPEYYKWTQWMFLLMYKNGLSYKKKAKVNWCENCKTVLANEQAEGGKCERCNNQVIQKDLEQWFFKITDFIENQEFGGRKIKGLLYGLDDVDWPESTKTAQKNWIGKSNGAAIKFEIRNQNPEKEYIEVFTTRPDTIFGCTYLVVSPEHPLISNFKFQISNKSEVEDYIEKTRKKSELERTDLNKDKAGVKLEGISAVNPANGEKIPIFVADYVLGGYGTGAIMAVPAHDERDFEFAKKYDLPIKAVILPENISDISIKHRYSDESALNFNKDIKTKKLSGDVVTFWEGESEKKGFDKLREDIKRGMHCYICDGVLINSGEFTGLASAEAREKMADWLEKNNCGQRKINYKLRDWCVSRQRYWGAPIPMIYCDKCGEVSVPEKDLPVKLPTDVDFRPIGESPLELSKSFHDVKCPKCSGPAKREADTMDTFVCSSWYYLRFIDPKNNQEFASRKKLDRWLPVDLYIGGAEHAVLHLLYARFFTKVLQKYGFVDFNEPFPKLRHQGMVLAEDGRKMSKSLGNVVNPDQIAEEYGADVLRVYLMFFGAFGDSKPWDSKGIVGVKRFLEKIISLKSKISDCSEETQNTASLHKTIKKVTEDIENFKFNTAISAMMILVNQLEKEKEISQEDYEKLLLMLSPFAPHLAEELWSQLGNQESIFKQKWPEYDPELIKEEEIEIPVQINGKVRDTIKIPVDMSEDEVKKAAMESEKVKKWFNGKEPRKVIYIKDKMISIVL